MSKKAYKEYLTELINEILYINTNSNECDNQRQRMIDNYDFTILVKMAKRVKEEIKKDVQTEELQ